jgi:hypothetical protein
MVLSIKDNTLKARNMDQVLSLGLMEVFIKDNSLKIILKDTESTTGLMEESTMEPG